MCIIIHKPAGVKFDQEILERGERINKDGFGGIVPRTRELIRTMNYHQAADWIDRREHEELVIHYRYTTKGQTGKKHCHPYNFKGGWLFSNGTVDGLGCDETCDTYHVARLVEEVPPEHWSHLFKMTPTRFAVVLLDGSVQRHGDWIEHEGIWYSKDNVLQKPWTPPARQPTWYEQQQQQKQQTTSTTVQVPSGYNSYKYRVELIEELGGAWGHWSEFTNDELEELVLQMDPYYETQADREREEVSRQPVIGFGYQEDYLDDPWASSADDDWEDWHLVAVYGTLKTGMSNHDLLSSGQGTRLVATGVTQEKLRLTANGIPYLHEGEHPLGTHIPVELYHVPDFRVRASLDRLEGHPTLYHRKLCTIQVDNAVNTTTTSWIYFYTGEPSVGARYHPCWPVVGTQAHKRYVKPEIMPQLSLLAE